MAMQVKHFRGQDSTPWQKANSFTYYWFKRLLWHSACANLVFGEVWRFALRWVLDFGGNFELIARNGKEADFERAGKAGGSL